MAISITIGVTFSFFVPYMTLFAKQEAGMSPIRVGIFLTLMALSGIILSTLLARYADRLEDKKPVLIFSLLSAATGYVMFSQIRSFWGLIAVGCTFLAIGAANYPQYFAFARAQMLPSGADSAQRGLTALRSAFAFAWVVGPLLGSVILHYAGFFGLFIGCALGFSVAAVLVWQTKSTPVVAATKNVDESHAKIPTHVLWIATASFVLYSMSMSIGMNWLPIKITENLAGTETNVGFVVGLCALLEVPVMLSFVWLKKRPSDENFMIFGFLLCAIYFVIITLAPSVGVIALAQFPRAIVVGITATIGMAYFQDLMPGKVATSLTLFSNAASMGGIFAGVTGGLIVEHIGLQSVFVFCSVIAFASFAMLGILSRYRNRSVVTAA